MSSIFSSDEEERDFILKVANMYLDGYSLRQIAAEVHLSHVSVRRYLLVKLPQVNPSLSKEVLEEIKNNTPKSIRDENVAKRVLSSFFKLVNEDKTVDQIAQEMSVSPLITYRDLTRRLEMLHDLAPEVVTEEMINKAASVLDQHALANLEIGSNMSVENQKREDNGRFVK